MFIKAVILLPCREQDAQRFARGGRRWSDRKMGRHFCQAAGGWGAGIGARDHGRPDWFGEKEG